MNIGKSWDGFEKIYQMYEKKYVFRFCQIDEIDRLVEFIDKYWQSGHIFTKSRELLDWQHLDKRNNRYNFVLAVDRKTEEIHAVIGFIMSDIYDEQIMSPIRWGAIWQVREDVGIKGLGLGLKYYFEKNAPACYIGGIGLSKYSRAIDEKLGELVGQLKCYYILNEQCQDFQLAAMVSNSSYSKVSSGQNHLKKIDSKNFAEKERDYFKKIPEYKSPLYYVNRYANHPIYRYEFLEVRNDKEEETACLIWRKCEANGHNAIMIVDYIGSGMELAGLHDEFQKLLQENDAEYICFYEFGLEEEGLIRGGFLDRDASEVIIPLYYEPFVQKNITLDFHFYAVAEKDMPIRIVKGDSDQDRPNRL